MTPEDINLISTLFKHPDPKVVSKKLNSLSRDRRKKLAETVFQLQKKIYGTVLEPSIASTYRGIHANVMHMFFTQLFHISENLRSDPGKWKAELKRLRQIELFSETSDFDLLSVAEHIKQVELQANIPFLKQYEEVPGVFLLKDPANVYEFNSKIPVISRSGIFGDDACATGEKESSITVKPLSDCTALFIPRDKFVRLLRNVPGLQEKVFQTVVDRAKQGSIRAEEQRRLTQEILDNIGQGSFSINVAGEIGENYTKIASDYLGSENLAGIPFADLAFRNDREKLRNYYRALHMLFSGSDFNHSVVLDLLPNEVKINNRDFQLHYSFVQDGAGHVMSVFVRMEDITLKREVERKEAQENAITARMQSNVGGFMDMLEDVSNTFHHIEKFGNEFWANNNKPPNTVIEDLMRMLHGSKGLTSQFELYRLKNIIHEFENWFISIEKEGIQEYSELFQELFMALENEMEYAVSFKENLGKGIIEILNGISFSKEQFELLEKASINNDLETIRSIIYSKNQTSAERIVSNWRKDALRLAEKLGKEVEVTIDIAENLEIPKDIAKKLNINLGHLYRNCIDHGIEEPDERISAGKPSCGKIEIKIRKNNNELFISISDDGAGIDNQKIVKLAVENPKLDQFLVNEYIETEAYWKLLFLPGFSSAETVTDISGRGVGMDAVKNAVESLDGTIDIQSRHGSGTEFVIAIPIRSF